MKKTICKNSKHKWKFNFPSLPNKSICSKCYIKAEFDLHKLEWENVKEFKNETRTNEELCKVWVN